MSPRRSCLRGTNSVSTLRSAQKPAAASALFLLLFALDGRFDARRSARIFPQHLAVRSAGRLFLLQRGQRLPQPQQRIGGLCGLLVLRGHREKSLRGIPILLALVVTLAQPILGIPDQLIIGKFQREIAHSLLGERIIPTLHIADAEVVFVARRTRRWRRRQTVTVR